MKVIGNFKGRAARDGSAGFTLLEVMIALAVVAIALVSLLALVNRSIEINGRLQKITRGTLLAQQQLAEIEVGAGTTGYTFQSEEGVFPEPDDEFSWRSSYEETPIPGLLAVTVTVVWGPAGSNEEVDLTSLVFQ